MAYVISVINQKGGTAKTTTSVSLAARLALNGKRVLLADMDPQGNSTMSFGIDTAQLDKSLYDVLVRDMPMDEILVATTIDKLHLAPGKVDLSKTDINLADRHRKQYRLKEALSQVLHRYDFVFIDCPPSYGLLPVNSLVASTDVLVPMVPQYFSLEGLKQVNASIEDIKKELNPQLDIVGIVFCMTDPRLKITQPSIDMVKNHYSGKVFETIVRNCSKVNEANLLGISVFEYDPQCRASIEYTELSHELLQRLTTRQGMNVDRMGLAAFKQLFGIH